MLTRPVRLTAVSSANPNPTVLPTWEITTTAQIPVAEIQTVVTRG